MKSSKVSVVIPTKNRSDELSRAISSVLNQSYQDFEVLVVDDHSEENILGVVESYNDKRIKYLKSNKIPSNANVCRNIGIENAKGEYVAMLDSDDEWMLNHLESKLKYLKEKKADGVFGSYVVDDGENIKEVISRPLKQNEKITDYILTDGRAQTSTYFLKSSAAKSVNWDEQLFRHQDYDFSIRFASNYEFIACTEVTCIVHWKLYEKRSEHLLSQKMFMQKHKNSISRNIYNVYHQNVYKSIFNRNDIEKSLMKYFNDERFRFITHISLNDYLSNQVKELSAFNKIIYRIKYLTKVLFS